MTGVGIPRRGSLPSCTSSRWLSPGSGPQSAPAAASAASGAATSGRSRWDSRSAFPRVSARVGRPRPSVSLVGRRPVPRAGVWMFMRTKPYWTLFGVAREGAQRAVRLPEGVESGVPEGCGFPVRRPGDGPGGCSDGGSRRPAGRRGRGTRRGGGGRGRRGRVLPGTGPGPMGAAHVLRWMDAVLRRRVRRPAAPRRPSGAARLPGRGLGRSGPALPGGAAGPAAARRGAGGRGGGGGLSPGRARVHSFGDARGSRGGLRGARRPPARREPARGVGGRALLRPARGRGARGGGRDGGRGAGGPVGRGGRGGLRGGPRRGTALACLQSANHEVGTGQPVAEAAEACRGLGVPLLVDAAQSLGWGPVEGGWSLLAASAHKWGGPAGWGCSPCARGAVRPARAVGRAGVGPGAGLREPAGDRGGGGLAAGGPGGGGGRGARLRALVDRIRARVPELVPDVEVVGDPVRRLPTSSPSPVSMSTGRRCCTSWTGRVSPFRPVRRARVRR